jgi:hypothetical protein
MPNGMSLQIRISDRFGLKESVTLTELRGAIGPDILPGRDLLRLRRSLPQCVAGDASATGRGRATTQATQATIIVTQCTPDAELGSGSSSATSSASVPPAGSGLVDAPVVPPVMMDALKDAMANMAQVKSMLCIGPPGVECLQYVGPYVLSPPAGVG